MNKEQKEALKRIIKERKSSYKHSCCEAEGKPTKKEYEDTLLIDKYIKTQKR